MLMSGFSKRIEKRFCPVDEAIYDPRTNPNPQMTRGDQVKPNGHLDGEHAPRAFLAETDQDDAR